MNSKRETQPDSTDETEEAGPEMLRKEPIDTSEAQSDQTSAPTEPGGSGHRPAGQAE